MKDSIVVKGAREHNLKGINIEIPKNKLVVLTGLSGSGKSSFAFDTIYAEGQRRYVESLSSYARQFLGVMKKPDVDVIEGLSPAISIDQKSTSRNPRSTVGTITEIYDYLRLLWARIGHPHCPACGTEITKQTTQQIVDAIFGMLTKQTSANPKIKLMILGPIVKGKKGEYSNLFADLKKRGYKKTRIDGKVFPLSEKVILIKTNKHKIDVVIDELVLSKETDRQRVLSAVEQGLIYGDGEVIVSKIEDSGFSLPEKPEKMKDELYSEKFACPACGTSMQEIEPRIFSFNTPYGACPECNGIGSILTADGDLVLNSNLSIREGGIVPFPNLVDGDTWFARTFKTFCEEEDIPTKKRLSEMSEEKKSLILFGSAKQYYVEGENRWGRRTTIHESFKGIANELRDKYESSESSFVRGQLEKFMRYETCGACRGTRLKKEALAVTVDGKSIFDVVNIDIEKAYSFVENLPGRLTQKEIDIGGLIIKEIKGRLTFLLNVGLTYLSLSRNAESLSGGEAQRIRLASQIGSGLTGVLYVLDEPSIGLHQRDNKKLIDTLKKLRDLGNTVLVVEHDQETMQASDLIIDFGPGAGEHGGKVVSFGTITEIMKDQNSLTGAYLSGRKKITYDGETGPTKETNDNITILKASEHNLKDITVSFPLQKLVVVTGVSGSGKSTLVNDILYHALMQKKNPYHRERPGKYGEIVGYEDVRHVYLIDQSPIGRTPRSNPATYTGAFNYIRDIFASTKEAKIRGYGPGRFSFNVKGGRCEACEGEGQIKIEMQFLPDVYVQCEVCEGKQYNKDVLEITYNEKNIADILAMSIAEALNFFSAHSALTHKLRTLNDVGLSYMKVGQPAPTLSGGEAQRVKLATELSKKGANSLYLLDEPTTGLHFQDLEKLLFVLKKLVSQGNTVVVIEHNLDIIKNADYIIDLGPEGGDKGGEIVAMGTPEDIAKTKASYTGQFLKNAI